jgi:heme exporter protein D
MTDLLPIAHAGHYLWTLYVVPLVIVVGSIVRSVREQRREKRTPKDDA